MSWQAIAERAAKTRCAAVLDRLEIAVAEHAPGARIARTADGIRVRERSLKARWLAEAGLRFARSIQR